MSVILSATVLCSLFSLFGPNEVRLSDLDLSRQECGWGTPQSRRSALKLPLQVGGVCFADGVGAHGWSRFDFDVRGKALSIDRAIAKMADQIKERCRGRDMSDTTLYITHSQCPGRARHTRDLVLSMVGFKDCKIMKAGGISTIYANAGGMIIAY